MTVIIDDLDAAICLLSELGKNILTGPCRNIQCVVRSVAREKGWRFVPYEELRAWACTTIDSTVRWLILDPLLARHTADFRTARSVRLRRVLEHGEWTVKGLDISAMQEGDSTSGFALFDDVAASGDTLEYAVRQVHSFGGKVEKIAVGVGSTTARRRIAAVVPQVQWAQFFESPDVAVHLRDACPFMPHSGRPVADRSVIETDRGAIEIRLPSVSLRIGPWREIYGDFRVLAAVAQGRISVERGLSEVLGREATVGDLSLLGDSVCLPLYAHQSARDATRLSDVARGL